MYGGTEREREREMVVRAECQELQGYEIHSASFCVLFYELRYVRRAGEIIDEGLVQGMRCRRAISLVACLALVRTMSTVVDVLIKWYKNLKSKSYLIY